MFEHSGHAAAPLTPACVSRFKAVLSEAVGIPSGLDDASRVDTMRALEELVCVATAAQAALATELDESQRAGQEQAGVPAERRGRGVALQVALARRESHHRGQRHLGLAKVVARELVAACQREAHRLDAASFVKRRRQAEGDRHVTLRPAPDSMAWLGALLPVKDGVAAKVALTRAADAARAAGDPRTRGQVEADTLVEAVPHGARPRSATPTTPRSTTPVARPAP